MKALVIADTDSAVQTIRRYVEPIGFDVIRYRSAIKALDNLDEIMPDAIFISAVDFPRHWKAIVQFVRSDTGKDRTVIVLLVNERFTSDDADKAIHVGVQAIVDETLASNGDEPKLAELFSRYKPIESALGSIRYEYETVSDRAAFMFTNPLNDAIITGKLEGLDANSILFRPDTASSVSELSEGDELAECSLKLADTIVNPECRVLKGGTLMRIEIVKLADGERKALLSFIGERE